MAINIGRRGIIRCLVHDLVKGGNIDQVFTPHISLFDIGGSKGITAERNHRCTARSGTASYTPLREEIAARPLGEKRWRK